MTPAARVQAAVEVLDAILAGTPAEKALTRWGRRSRFAGSGDRAAVRDHVFHVLRRRRSCAALGGGATGRALMIGALSGAGQDVPAHFSGARHGPAPLTPSEAAHIAREIDLPELVALDCPDWLAPELRRSLGTDFAPVMERLRDRAPVFVRVNTLRADRPAARAALAAEGIEARPHPLADTALEVTANARRIGGSAAYRDGLVELQDAASQAVIAGLPELAGRRVLDYCAGGGGKSLALAARGAEVAAHDADPGRMRDLPARAARAGAPVQIVDAAAAARGGPYDLVLVDAPCSGSGAWRRAPAGKWRLTPERLNELCTLQETILGTVRDLVAPGGWLVYVTCSLLEVENGERVAAFLAANPDWRSAWSRRFTPLDGGDGFFVAHLTQR